MEKRKSRKLVVVAAVAVLTILGLVTYAAAKYWKNISLSSGAAEWSALDDYEKLSMTPGADETQLNFAWYSHMEESPRVRYSNQKEHLSDATIYEGTQEKTEVPYNDMLVANLEGKKGTYYSNKVTITGLAENTTYYYQIFQNGSWSKVETYKTKGFDSYSVLYFSDPQIGAGENQNNPECENLWDSSPISVDSYCWDKIIANGLKKHNVSFMISAGDQVESSKNEKEYAGFLNPAVMLSTPLATTIGNHDCSSYNYTWHFNNPNNFNIYSEAMTNYTKGHSNAGSDYYYSYGSVLYIVLDTNNDNCATHENIIAKAVKENPDCIWRVVTMHHDIYGSGADHSDSDSMVLRTQLTPLMD